MTRAAYVNVIQKQTSVTWQTAPSLSKLFGVQLAGCVAAERRLLYRRRFRSASFFPPPFTSVQHQLSKRLSAFFRQLYQHPKPCTIPRDRLAKKVEEIEKSCPFDKYSYARLSKATINQL